MIQIRNVPETLHRELKSRAVLAGMPLSDYILHEIRQVAERPTLAQLRARLDSRPPPPLCWRPPKRYGLSATLMDCCRRVGLD